MIVRKITEEFIDCATEYPVVTILGPRQSGKTTLAQMTFPEKKYFSLENPDTRLFAENDPRAFLDKMKDGGIIDEIQRLPLLLSYIQGIVDEHNIPGQFILTGSHQPLLHEAISQSLAGRTAILNLWPFSINEIKNYDSNLKACDLIVKSGFPRVYEQNLKMRRFYNNYLQTYIERDLRTLLQLKNLSLFQNFLKLLAGRVGQLINYTSITNDLGVSTKTIQKWISVLKASFIIFEVQPYHGNIRKRLIKSSKLYFIDTGLAAFLLGIYSGAHVLRDPLRGNLYENLIIADVIKEAQNSGIRPEIYFYRDSNNNEVDLIVQEKGWLHPVEIKSSKTFSKTFLKGLNNFQELNLPRCKPGIVFYNGPHNQMINDMKIINPLTSLDLWKTIVL